MFLLCRSASVGNVIAMSHESELADVSAVPPVTMKDEEDAPAHGDTWRTCLRASFAEFVASGKMPTSCHSNTDHIG
jgi:hypothetical protein